ncbi:MAG: hypothetical protein V1851_01965 [Patescibacteria group bacterium]
MQTKQILKWPLIVGIVVVLNLFFAYAIKVAYPEPEYTNFCEDKPIVKQIDNQEECLVEGGQWTENIERLKPVSMYEGEMMTVDNPTGWCNQQFTCNEEYQTAREDYERNVFMALVIFGVIVTVIGFMTQGKEVISVAMSLGGVLSFIIASIRYWQYASDWLHLAILGIALGVLIYLGIKKFTDN